VVNLCYQSVHKNFGTWINFYDTRSIRQNLIAGHWTFFKVWGCQMHERKGCKRRLKYVQSAWVTTVPDLLIFYSILFYSMTILKTQTKPYNESSSADIL
jgi:hypothetical protein